MIEIVTNLQERGQFDDPRKLAKILPYKADLFRSVYTYGADIIEYIQQGKDFNLYDGIFDIQDLVIDVDGHNNDKGLELAKGRIRDMVNWLLGKGVDTDNFLVWFSGGGFHLSIAASLFDFKPGNNLPDSVRDTALTLFPGGDNIYYPKALIRVGYSYNTKRKAWKVPLHIGELEYDVKQIREMAQTPDIRPMNYTREVYEPTLVEYRVNAKDKFRKNDKVELPEHNDFINVVTCMHKLYDRGPVEGRRHTDMLRLASWMRRAHMPEPVIVDSLMNWSVNIKEAEIQKIIHDVFTKDYRYGCNDSVRSEYCDSRCIYFANKNEGMEASTQEEMDKEMQVYAMTGGYTTFIDLADIVGQTYKIYPGEFVVVTGPSGVNKSTLVQQIAVSTNDQKTLYVSTEVDRKLMYRRFLQQVTHMSKEEIIEIYSSGNTPPGSERLAHLKIIDQVSSFERLTQTILQLKPTVLIIDVIEDVGGNDALDNIATNAKLCKQLAMSLGIIIIAVGHMRKAAATGRKTNKTLDDAKGSGALVQKADKVIMVEGDQRTLTRHVHSGKARDEKPFDINMRLDINTFTLEKV